MSRLTNRLMIGVGILSGLLAVLSFSPQAVAVTAADWNAGNIMQDTTFFNPNGMSTNDIQNFLNSKVPTCDTNGTQPYGGTTRAAYGASRGYPAPFTCLKNYVENPTTHQNNANGGSVSGGWTSASIIKYAADVHGINPKVLIVLLEKEQALVTDDWPWTLQYRSATGYGCPDTAPCDAEYYGFYNQVMNAASQFRRYANNPGSYRHKAAQNNSVYWSPNTAACGSSTVYIHNQTTAGLYNYTPYQPNAAALANMYGTGDGCSAYGNRNFWRTFSDWFGLGGTMIGNVPVSNITAPNPSPARGQTVTYTYTLTNSLPSAITLDAVGLVGRLGSTSGPSRDFGWQGSVTLQPNVPQQFSFTTTLRDTGVMYVWPAFLYQGTYTQYNNWGSTLNIRAPNFTLSQPLTATPSAVYAGQDVTFSAVLKNNESTPISYDAIGIPVKFYNRYSYDATWVGPGVIGAGQEITLSGVRNIDKPGPFTYWVSNYYGGTYSTIGSVKSFDSNDITPSFTVSGLNLNNTTLAQGENLTASFTVKNNLPVPIDVDGVGVVGRYGAINGQNRDLGWQGPTHFDAGETKTFSGYSRAITDAGNHYYWIGVHKNGGFIQYNNWGSTVVSLAPNFTVSGLNLSSTTPAQGENLTASFTVRNNLSVPIGVDGVGVVGRYGSFNGQNRDLGWQGPVQFSAGETKAFSGYSRAITDVGNHYYWVGVFDIGRFLQYNNWGSTVISH